MAPLRLGVYVNNRAAVFLDDAYSLGALVALAQEAEARGLDFVSVGDSVLAKPRYAPIVTLAGIAAATRTIGLTTGILQPHLRNPVLLAQEWATLDVLSGGRTSLAVGLGTGPRPLVDAELALAGISRRTRARAFEESIETVRRLWQGEAVTFTGAGFRLDGAEAGFAPAQPGGPPIVVACGAYIPARAGTGPNDVHRADVADSFIGPFARVARLGDGWITGMATPEEWAHGWASIRAAATALGRDVEHPGFERRVNTFLHVDADDARARALGAAFMEDYHRLPMDDASLDRWLVSGSPATCAARLRRFADAGATSFQFVLASADQRTQLARLSDEVRPLLGAS